MRKATPAGGIVATWLPHLLVSTAQATAERRNRNVRLEAQKQDRKLQAMLGFAASQR